LALVPGVEVAPHPGDGRIVIVLEDVDAVTRAVNDDSGDSAAARFARIAQWPEVLAASLVYEYSGPDAPPPGSEQSNDFHDWRSPPGAPPNPRTRTRRDPA
ncbi:MAG: chaperone NapD, partial [Betaproteobacteria bacterium]|nr:chaperone NapD [Betaproteobacteria bacterium]